MDCRIAASSSLIKLVSTITRKCRFPSGRYKGTSIVWVSRQEQATQPCHHQGERRTDTALHCTLSLKCEANSSLGLRSAVSGGIKHGMTDFVAKGRPGGLLLALWSCRGAQQAAMPGGDLGIRSETPQDGRGCPPGPQPPGFGGVSCPLVVTDIPEARTPIPCSR